MLFSLYLEKENTIRPNPIPNSSGLCIAKFFNPGNRGHSRPSLSTTPLQRRTLSCTPPVHDIKFEPARIADHDAYVGQIVGGAVSSVFANEAIHATTLTGPLLGRFELSTK